MCFRSLSLISIFQPGLVVFEGGFVPEFRDGMRIRKSSRLIFDELHSLALS
jgi:hypothetical protein